VTVHNQYNDVNNRQDATTFSFINLFKSALHVSGDKFAYPQEQFLTVYTAFGTMHRHCRPVASSVGALYQICYILLVVYIVVFKHISSQKCCRFCYDPAECGLMEHKLLEG